MTKVKSGGDLRPHGIPSAPTGRKVLSPRVRVARSTQRAAYDLFGRMDWMREVVAGWDFVKFGRKCEDEDPCYRSYYLSLVFHIPMHITPRSENADLPKKE